MHARFQAPSPGLCASCIHSRQVVSGRASVFWLCERSKADPRFRKYPPIPVVRCEGFERADAGEDGPG
ncbi:MAG: hypothetical protein IT301_09035 [Dehalococcoidia bacterium]|nr:hypothetical protein [Dehalococcoidia bacterium]